MTAERRTGWCRLAVAALLFVASAAHAAAPPIHVGLLAGSKPTPTLFEPIRKALAALDPALAERIVVDQQFASFDLALMERQAASMMAQRPALALALDMSSGVALAKARGKGVTPIIFRAHDNPLAAGLIASYAKPGRNTTGITTYRCLDDKLLELLLDAFPAARRIGFMTEPGTPDWGCHQRALDFAAGRGMTLAEFKLGGPADVPAALEAVGKARLDAMVVPVVASTWMQRKRIVAAMDSLGLPAIYEARAFTDIGGLMHFGAIDQDDISSRIAQLIVKVLAGENAGEIPVSQPTRFELVVNLKAANARRYGISAKVLRRADRIDE